MTREAVIRAAREDDLPELGVMAGRLVRAHHETDPQRFFLPERVEEDYASWLGQERRRKGALVLVAEVDGRVAGYLYATVEGRDWNALLDEHGAIQDVFVDAAVRRHGVGRKLVEAAVTELVRRGVTRVVLHTMTQNEAAQRLFAACGFRPTMLEMTRAPV